MKSLLTKHQEIKKERVFTRGGKEHKIIATIRYDDRCGNGHNTFSITGEIWKSRNGSKIGRDCESCGCIHEDIEKHFPELAPFIKWHLFDSTGPMYYIANTTYHALEHGPKKAWIYYTGPSDPLNIEGTKERLLSYENAETAKKAEGMPGYRIVWDEKSAKKAELNHARSSAVWPEATDEELRSPDLEDRLKTRLPALLSEFKQAVESLGMVF